MIVPLRSLLRGGFTPLVRPALALGRSSASSASFESIYEQLGTLRQALAEAVESAEAVGASAQVLLLETDPAARGPREQYERHYSELALTQLQGALEQVAHLRERLGREEADALLRRERLAVAVADVQLWRDRTAATIAAGMRREEANEVVCQD